MCGGRGDAGGCRACGIVGKGLIWWALGFLVRGA